MFLCICLIVGVCSRISGSMYLMKRIESQMPVTFLVIDQYLVQIAFGHFRKFSKILHVPSNNREFNRKGQALDWALDWVCSYCLSFASQNWFQVCNVARCATQIAYNTAHLWMFVQYESRFWRVDCLDSQLGSEFTIGAYACLLRVCVYVCILLNWTPFIFPSWVMHRN